MTTNTKEQSKELAEARYKEFIQIVQHESRKCGKEGDVHFELDYVGLDGGATPCNLDNLPEEIKEEMFIRATAWWEVYSEKDMMIDEVSVKLCLLKEGFTASDYCFDKEEVREQVKREFVKTARTEGLEVA